MSPKACASLLVKIAQEDPIYDNPGAVDELIYLFAWYFWDMLEQDAAEWTENLGRELDRLRAGITSQGSDERFSAYSEVKANDEGGGPVWHIARTFQTYVLGSAPMDVTQTMEVAVRLTAMMKGLQAAIVGEAE